MRLAMPGTKLKMRRTRIMIEGRSVKFMASRDSCSVKGGAVTIQIVDSSGRQKPDDAAKVSKSRHAPVLRHRQRCNVSFMPLRASILNHRNPDYYSSILLCRTHASVGAPVQPKILIYCNVFYRTPCQRRGIDNLSYSHYLIQSENQ